jgi:hypothetical protein
MQESEQLNLELDALRTENDNLKAALHTAERLLGQRDAQLDDTTQHSTAQEPRATTVIWPDPATMTFDLERKYDPMTPSNRGNALKLREPDHPRRRRGDNED